MLPYMIQVFVDVAVHDTGVTMFPGQRCLANGQHHHRKHV